MSQVEEFVKIVEGVKDHDVKVVIVTGNRAAVKVKYCVKLLKRKSGITSIAAF